MLAKAAKELGVITQRIQGHFTDTMRRVCEWTGDGALEREVDAGSSLAFDPWSHAIWSRTWNIKPADFPPGEAKQRVHPPYRNGWSL